MDFETGAAIAVLTQRAITRIQRGIAAAKPARPLVEPSVGQVIERLTRAAMPQVQRDAKAIQKAKAAGKRLY